MEQAGAILVAVVSTLGTVAAAYLTARKYGKLGIAPAQLQLSDTLQRTMDAQATEIASLRRQLDDAESRILEMAADFKGCKKRLIALERTLANRAAGLPDDAS